LVIMSKPVQILRSLAHGIVHALLVLGPVRLLPAQRPAGGPVPRQAYLPILDSIAKSGAPTRYDPLFTDTLRLPTSLSLADFEVRSIRLQAGLHRCGSSRLTVIDSAYVAGPDLYRFRVLFWGPESAFAREVLYDVRCAGSRCRVTGALPDDSDRITGCPGSP